MTITGQAYPYLKDEDTVTQDEQVCTRLQTREEQREVPAPVS